MVMVRVRVRLVRVLRLGLCPYDKDIDKDNGENQT